MDDYCQCFGVSKATAAKESKWVEALMLLVADMSHSGVVKQYDSRLARVVRMASEEKRGEVREVVQSCMRVRGKACRTM